MGNLGGFVLILHTGIPPRYLLPAFLLLGAAHLVTTWESKWKGLRIAPLKLAGWHWFKNMVGTQAGKKGGGTFLPGWNLWLSSQERPFPISFLPRGSGPLKCITDAHVFTGEETDLERAKECPKSE